MFIGFEVFAPATATAVVALADVEVLYLVEGDDNLAVSIGGGVLDFVFSSEVDGVGHRDTVCTDFIKQQALFLLSSALRVEENIKGEVFDLLNGFGKGNASVFRSLAALLKLIVKGKGRVRKLEHNAVLCLTELIKFPDKVFAGVGEDDCFALVFHIRYSMHGLALFSR